MATTAHTITPTPERTTTEKEPEPQAETQTQTQKIDALLAHYLSLLDEYTTLCTALGTLQSAVYRDLARANFAAERGVRYYGRDYYDERMRAGRRVRVRMEVNAVGEMGGGRGEAGVAGRAKDGGAGKGECREHGEEEEEGGGLSRPVFTVGMHPPPSEDGQGSEKVVDQPEAKAGSDSERDSGVVGDGDGEGAGDEKDSGQADSATRDGGEDVEEKPKPKPADPLRWFGILTPLPLRQAQGHSIKAVEEIIPRLATLSAEMAGVELEVRRARKRRAKAEKAEEKRIVELEAKMEKVDVGA